MIRTLVPGFMRALVTTRALAERPTWLNSQDVLFASE